MTWCPRLLIGTQKTVKDMLGIHKEGGRGHLTGIIRDTYTELGPTLIKAVYEISGKAREELRKAFSEGTGKGASIDLRSLTDFDVVAFSIGKAETILEVKLKIHFLTAASTTKAVGDFNDLRALWSMKSDIPPQARALLDKVSISAKESWVNIDSEITLGEVEGLLQMVVQ